MAYRRRRVVWAKSARQALDDAIGHIAGDSRAAARRVLSQALEAASTLTSFAGGTPTWLTGFDYVEQRTGKGSHRQFVHSTTGKVITVSVHTEKEVGTGLAHRILKEAGL